MNGKPNVAACAPQVNLGLAHAKFTWRLLDYQVKLTKRHYIVIINDIMSRPQVTALTRSHQRILSALAEISKNGDIAPISALVSRLQFAGSTSVMNTLRIMERNGFVQVLGGGGRGKRQTIVLTPKGKVAMGIGGTPVLGSVPAGPLSEAVANCDEIADLGTAIPYQAGDFLLIVNGNSMVGAGILSGDRVLLRPGVQVRNGEIAAVHYGDEYLATLKHVCFDKDGEVVTLKASNTEYSDITISGRDLQVAGVFRGLIRMP